MPAIAKERQQYHLSKVRSLIAENHQITFEEIVEQLDRRFGLKFDRDYVTKLAKKIFVERTKRADRLTLNYALAAFDDVMNAVVQKAWEIRMEPPGRDRALTVLLDLNLHSYQEAHVGLGRPRRAHVRVS